ncbi:sugar kinase [Dictyobacter alpinus]|uniref:Sugar kinase n=1 Tax=Dictyobacter alpinus TaxID=2014873 RepID=A0A402BCV5_9CHLR|nr:ROK family transcriptional regulator [Dictyobacter alpinus]GCE29231.1 sugar kinase [Dictyobacter alpinus]
MEEITQRITRASHEYDQPLAAMQGADMHLLREFNRLLVLNHVRQFGPLTRVSIAQRLGLSRATVSSIIDVLLHDGMIREGKLLDATPRGGRRAILVHFNAEVACVLGIDVGRSHLTLLLTNLSADILAQHTCAFYTETGPEQCIPLLITEIREFIERSKVNWDAISGMGLGIPGPLTSNFQALSSPPHMPGWDNVKIWQTVHDAFSIPLIIDKDANMGALAENRCGAGRGHLNLAYIKSGTGIGGGLIFDAHIYRGHSGSAGEIGHQTIDENGPLCVCGNHGCLETFAGTHAIVADAVHGTSLLQKQAKAQIQMGEIPMSRERPVQSSSTHQESPVKISDISAVIQAAQQGDAACIAAIQRAGERIGIILAGLINSFNPSAIVIGGGMIRAGDLLLTPLRRVAQASSLPIARCNTTILTSELGGHAVALGAALSVIDAAFAMPTISPISPYITHSSL